MKVGDTVIRRDVPPGAVYTWLWSPVLWSNGHKHPKTPKGWATLISSPMSCNRDGYWDREVRIQWLP